MAGRSFFTGVTTRRRGANPPYVNRPRGVNKNTPTLQKTPDAPWGRARSQSQPNLRPARLPGSTTAALADHTRGRDGEQAEAAGLGDRRNTAQLRRSRCVDRIPLCCQEVAVDDEVIIAVDVAVVVEVTLEVPLA